jgi:hypothetical protein
LASREIDVKFKEGGAKYLRSIERLGLRPDALFWAYDKTVDKFVLVLVTDEYDYVGPMALSKTLFEAYNKAATPIEIDPFIVRMHSPRQWIIKEIGKFLPFKASFVRVTSPDGKPIEGVDQAEFVGPMVVNASDLEVSSDWVYRFEKPKKPKTVELARRWRRFTQNVSRVAA